MTFFTGSNLAISLPADLLGATSFAGSVVKLSEFDTSILPADLRFDLESVLSTFALSPSQILLIYRSEMFTHGESLAWLRTKLVGVDDHLCFSDGGVLKSVPGFRNHLYFFRSSSSASRRHFSKTLTRAPELFAAFESQINSAFTTVADCTRGRPETVVIQSGIVFHDEVVSIFPFYLDPSRVEQSLNWVRTATIPTLTDEKCETTTVVYLTEAALAHTAFVHHLSQFILDHFFDSRQRIVLLLPPLDFMGASPIKRLSTLAYALTPHLGDVPNVRSASIYVAACALDQLDNDLCLGGRHLICPTSAAVWRYQVSCFDSYLSACVVMDDTGFDMTQLSAFYDAVTGGKSRIIDLDTVDRLTT